MLLGPESSLQEAAEHRPPVDMKGIAPPRLKIKQFRFEKEMKT